MSAITRRTASSLAAVGVGVLLGACGQSAVPEPIGSLAAQPQPAPSEHSNGAEAGYDISRIDAVQKDFPEGFTVRAGLSKTLGQHDVDNAGTDVLTEARLDPPHCLPMIIPAYATPTVGAQAAGVVANGEPGGVQVTALRLPGPVSVGQAPAGCDRVAIAGSANLTGTAERLPAVDIDAVTTSGVKLAATGDDGPADYIFTAALNDRTVVVVRSNVDATVNPPQFLSNLLVKAVSAVRGR